MILRRPRPVPTVVTRRATPDRGRIRAWSADDTAAREEEAFSRKPQGEQIEAAITAWVAQFRGINDPDRQRDVAKAALGRDLAEEATSHRQIIEDSRDPRIVIRPKHGRWNDLKLADRLQFAGTRTVHTDPKAPGKGSRWWQFVKDTRKVTEDGA